MSVSLPSYLTLIEADAIAATLPLLEPYRATVDSAIRFSLLVLATMRVDKSRRWQGRRLAADQVLELPRESFGDCQLQDAKLATLYEANAIADGTRDRISAAIAAGLTGQSTGGISEQYRQIIAGQAGVQALCPEADRFVAGYRLVSGRII